MRRAILIASVALIAFAAVPTGAWAQNQLFQDFRKNGSIDPCKYSDGQLRKGLNGLPPDIQQYAPGFADQLRSGRGNCGGGGGGGGGGTQQQGSNQQGQGGVPGAPGGGGGGPGGPSPKPQIHKPPAPAQPPTGALAGTATPTIDARPTGSNAPGWLLLLGLLVLAGGVAALVARHRGWSAADRLRPLRAAFSEAGGHVADSAATTRDRLRLGRG